MHCIDRSVAHVLATYVSPAAQIFLLEFCAASLQSGQPGPVQIICLHGFPYWSIVGNSMHPVHVPGGVTPCDCSAARTICGKHKTIVIRKTRRTLIISLLSWAIPFLRKFRALRKCPLLPGCDARQTSNACLSRPRTFVRQFC